MFRSVRSSLTVTVPLALTSVALWWMPIPVKAASCVLQLKSDTQTCYAPSQLRQAERRAPFVVINPTAMVQSESRLRLSQLSTIAEQNGKVAQLAFIYGALSGHSDLIALPGHGSAEYVLVQEIRGQTVPAQPHMTGARARGPWTFTATAAIHSQRLSLIVTSNISRTTVQTMGSRLLSSSNSGK